MANHMAEVAKMLGVELGEEFECSNGYKYILREDGIFESKHIDGFSTNKFAPALVALLNGEIVIKHKPWKPSGGDKYWYISSNGSACYYHWTSDVLDFLFYKVGNCYRTQEEAEANRDKWIAFYASDKVFEV